MSLFDNELQILKSVSLIEEVVKAEEAQPFGNLAEDRVTGFTHNLYQWTPILFNPFYTHQWITYLDFNLLLDCDYYVASDNN